MEKYKKLKEKNPAIAVSIKTMIVNAFLSVFKLFIGICFHSTALVSDAIHSASDMLSTIFVIIGVKVSQKQSDEKHPYGHERFESVATMMFGVILGVTAILIATRGISDIKNYKNLQIPGFLALIGAVVSIAIKEWMFWYTKKVAKKINSSIVMADAWHHRSDAFSSIGALIGIIGARMNIPVLDAVASIVICAFILKATIEIFIDSFNKMTDNACDKKLANEIMNKCLEQKEVCKIKNFKSRLFGSKIYIDVEVVLDGDLQLRKSDIIAENIHESVENNFPMVKHCSVITRAS